MEGGGRHKRCARTRIKINGRKKREIEDGEVLKVLDRETRAKMTAIPTKGKIERKRCKCKYR